MNSIQYKAAEPRVYTVKDIMHILELKKSKAYQLCASGQFAVKKIGREVRIDIESFEAWFDSL